MTPEEQDYWNKNNVETENVKYAVANGLMDAKDSGLSDAKLDEKPLTVSEALEVADPAKDFATEQPAENEPEKITINQ